MCTAENGVLFREPEVLHKSWGDLVGPSFPALLPIPAVHD
jgi:hypothetical protein